ncbi:MAG: dockerin type I repeat-containing protein [bacterium]|nr:dockerin type I repeat-containing protein [bacterium]
MRRRLLILEKYAIFLALFFSVSITSTQIALAEEFTSSSFRILDPVIAPAEFSTSTSFQLWSTLGEMALGTSTGAAFNLGAGFLRFPFASTPAVSATAGDAQVALSWTASQGYLGWTASGYKVGQATVSGGPYTFTDVGAVTSSTRTGLTNGTLYYFVITVKDAFGNSIATSTQVSATPVAATPSPSSGGGGGGGGGIFTSPAVTQAIFSGRAYPLSKVVVLKDGQIAITTIAGPDARFEVSLSGITTGNYLFSVYGEDAKGIRSSMFTFSLFVTSGSSSKVSGIFLAPTISVDKSEVKRGENIAIFGQSAPTSEVTIQINSEQEFFVKTPSDNSGVYLLNFDTSLLEIGNHQTKSKAGIAGEVSSFSNSVAFAVGLKNVLARSKKVLKGDLNDDGRVNLIDFSIAAYWYKRSISPVFAIKEVEHLNGDKKINLVDFSIMAYYWTG